MEGAGEQQQGKSSSSTKAAVPRRQVCNLQPHVTVSTTKSRVVTNIGSNVEQGSWHCLDKSNASQKVWLTNPPWLDNCAVQHWQHNLQTMNTSDTTVTAQV